MKCFFSLLFLLLLTKAVVACTCAPQPEFKSKEDLKRYDFVALVEITALPPKNLQSFMKLRVNGDINLTIKELFKGESTLKVYDGDFNDDCALNLHEGENWLFFGTSYNGKTFISRCSYTRLYSDTLGKREWQYFTGIKELDVLRKLYEHPVNTNYSKKVFYKNGQVEIEQQFKNEQLDGGRKIYYPSGHLYITEKFGKGARVDYRKIYSKTGQLIYDEIYNKGQIKQITAYQDTAETSWYLNFKAKHTTDPLFGDARHNPQIFVHQLDSLKSLQKWDKRIMYIYNYDNDGQSYSFESFHYNDIPLVKTNLDWNKKIEERWMYYEDGKIQSYSKLDQLNDQQIEYDYDSKGIRRDFINKCERCKFSFDETLPPHAAPEKVYIQ